MTNAEALTLLLLPGIFGGIMALLGSAFGRLVLKRRPIVELATPLKLEVEVNHKNEK